MDKVKELFENKMSAENMPQVILGKDIFNDDTVSLLDVMVTAGVAKSKGEGKTLISQGGISLDDEKVAYYHERWKNLKFEALNGERPDTNRHLSRCQF